MIDVDGIKKYFEKIAIDTTELNWSLYYNIFLDSRDYATVDDFFLANKDNILKDSYEKDINKKILFQNKDIESFLSDVSSVVGTDHRNDVSLFLKETVVSSGASFFSVSQECLRYIYPFASTVYVQKSNSGWLYLEFGHVD